MTQVVCDMSISLDGYVTGPNDSRENPSAMAPRCCTTGCSTRRPMMTEACWRP